MPVFQLVGALVAVALVAIIAYGRVAAPPAVRVVANLVLGLIAVGIILWLINTYVPMANSIKVILNVVVVVATCVGVLRVTGLWDEVLSLWNRMKYRSSH